LDIRTCLTAILNFEIHPFLTSMNEFISVPSVDSKKKLIFLLNTEKNNFLSEATEKKKGKKKL
jgi:hypothetical protein